MVALRHIMKNGRFCGRVFSVWAFVFERKNGEKLPKCLQKVKNYDKLIAYIIISKIPQVCVFDGFMSRKEEKL